MMRCSCGVARLNNWCYYYPYQQLPQNEKSQFSRKSNFRGITDRCSSLKTSIIVTHEVPDSYLMRIFSLASFNSGPAQIFIGPLPRPSRKYRITTHRKASSKLKLLFSSLLFSSLYMAAFRGLARLLGQQSGLNPTSSSSSLIPPSHLVFRRGIASKLFVGGLSFYTTDKALSEAFSQYGQVVEATIVMDRVSDRSKGFGFVTFASEDEAQNAMQDMNGKVLNGRVIFVDNAKPTVRFSSSDGMPIARGPPGPKSDN